MVAEGRLYPLQAQQLRELRIVPERRMRVKRQMVGRNREIRLQRRADDVPDTALNPLDPPAPRDPVMDNQELRARLRRGLDGPHACVDGKGHRGNCLSV